MKKDIFKKELSYIYHDDIREFTETAINRLPDYFFTIPASTSGKYHPSYALGEGGLTRHTKAAVVFASHLLKLEQYTEIFTQREKDCIISAIIIHDGWKCGDKGSQYTVHEHPQICADWVLNSNLFDDIISKEDRNLIAMAVSSHMGEWNTNTRSTFVLNKPETELQRFVHMCDYLASRKDIEVLFDGEDSQEQKPKEKEYDIETYKMTFGKYNNWLITEVAKYHYDYLEWMQRTMTLRHPLDKFVPELLNRKD